MCARKLRNLSHHCTAMGFTELQNFFLSTMHWLHCSGDFGASELKCALTDASVAFLTCRKSGWLCLQQPSQPMVHARAIFASNGSFLCFSWYASALSSQKVSLVKASGAESHSHSSFSMASFKFWHIVLHHSSQHSVQVPDVQYMISYFSFSLSLHLGSSTARSLASALSSRRANAIGA